MIGKVIVSSEKVDNLPIEAQLLYTWMIPFADDFGFLPGTAKTIKANIFPMKDITVEQVGSILELIWNQHLISLVPQNGKQFYHINDFEKHQNLKRDRQPQTILDFKNEEKPKDSWNKAEKMVSTLLGTITEPQQNQIGTHLEPEVNLSKVNLNKINIYASENKLNTSASGKIEKIVEEIDKYDPIKYPYQSKGLELWELLKAPTNKKSEFIRIVRDYPEGIISSAFAFAIDYPVVEIRWKMFFKKLNSLIKKQ